MKNYFLLLLLLLTACITAKKTNKQELNQDLKQLLDYTQKFDFKPLVNIYEPKENKKIIYIAVEHISNPLHPTAQKIKDLIENEKPDFCILEGFDPSEGISPKRIINKANEKLSQNLIGENLYAAYLCDKCNIPFIGADARESSYINTLAKEGFSLEDIVFFLVAQQINFWNKDNIVNETNIKNLVGNLIKDDISWWLEQKLDYTYEDFLKWHEKNTNKQFDLTKDFLWKNTEDFIPSLENKASIYQKIQVHIMYIRDLHILNVIQDALKKYNKILIVYGGSHYVWQKKALEYLFKPSVSQIFIDNFAN